MYLGSRIPQQAYALPELLQLPAAVYGRSAGEQVIREEYRRC